MLSFEDKVCLVQKQIDKIKSMNFGTSGEGFALHYLEKAMVCLLDGKDEEALKNYNKGCGWMMI